QGFFRRSLIRNGDYSCQGTGNCPIAVNRRKSCGKCRYNRCLEVGMSKEAIKTGRYTYQKRNQDSLEIQILERVKQETGLDSTQLADIKDPLELLRRSDDIMTNRIGDQDRNNAECLSPQDMKSTKDAERCRLQDEIFGQMGIVEYEEHQRIYDSTGLDVDNRLSSIDHVAELMDADIRHYIAFLKTIPGFRSFSVSDQTALVKGE
ncbi:hypothetical protein EGW08_012632, partial [Elysia chlorotica]